MTTDATRLRKYADGQYISGDQRYLVSRTTTRIGHAGERRSYTHYRVLDRQSDREARAATLRQAQATVDAMASTQPAAKGP